MTDAVWKPVLCGGVLACQRWPEVVGIHAEINNTVLPVCINMSKVARGAGIHAEIHNTGLPVQVYQHVKGGRNTC